MAGTFSLPRAVDEDVNRGHPRHGDYVGSATTPRADLGVPPTNVQSTVVDKLLA